MTKIELVIKACEDKIAEDIVTIPLGERNSIADYFVIVTASVVSHAQAIADEIDRLLSKEGYNSIGIEGYKEGNWVLVDYGDIIVHIFSRENRQYYDLERLWSKEEK